MSSTLEILTTVAAASITTTTVLGLVLHELLKRWLGSKFDREIESLKAKHSRELAHLQAQLANQGDAERRITQLRLDATPRICEAAYRAKKDTVEFIDYNSLKDRRAAFGRALKRLADKNQQALADLCIRYIGILSTSEFELLHNYKNLYDQLATAAGIIELKPTSEDAAASIATLRTKIEVRFEEVAQAFRSEQFLRQH